jgi:tetratricopeptide (TPR) repeat protein
MHRALLDTIATQKGKSTDAAFLAAGYERLGDERNARLWLKRGIRAAASAGLFEEAIVLGDRLAALTTAPRARQRIGLDGVRFAIVGRLFDDARRRLDHFPNGSALPTALDIERRICFLEIARGIGEADVEDAQLIADADRLGDPTLRCEARLAMAGISPTEEGMRLAGEAVELASSLERAMEFAARVRRLEINHARNRPDSVVANEDLRRTFAIATAAKSAFKRIHVEGDLAIREANLGQVEAAISRLLRLVEEARTRRMLGQERLLLQNLSVLLMREGRNEEAAEASKRAAKLAMAAGDIGLSGRALSARADALRRMGSLAEALACADEALTLQEQIRDPRRALTLLRRAEIRRALGDVATALIDTESAHRIADAANELDLRLSARLLRVLLRAAMGDVSEEYVREVLAETENASFTRGPMTIRLMEEVLALQKALWLKGP